MNDNTQVAGNDATAAGSTQPHGEDLDTIVNRLKAERVQSTIRQRLKAERVQDELKSMPGWKLLPDGKGIDRVRDFPDMAVAAAYVGFAEKLAQRSKLPLSVYMLGGHVLVTVRGPKDRGRYNRVNDTMLELARQLG